MISEIVLNNNNYVFVLNCSHAHLFITLRCTIPSKIILSAQSAKKSDILTFIIVDPSCLAINFKWSQDALQSDSNRWMFKDSSSKSIFEALVIAPI